MRLVAFEPEHVSRLDLLPAQREQLGADWMAPYGEFLVQDDLAWSGFVGETLVGFAGLIPLWSGVAECWALFSTHLPRHKLAAVRAILAFLDAVQPARFHRIQAVVASGYEPGHRLAEVLGFRKEGLRLGYGKQAQDFWRYARNTGVCLFRDSGLPK